MKDLQYLYQETYPNQIPINIFEDPYDCLNSLIQGCLQHSILFYSVFMSYKTYFFICQIIKSPFVGFVSPQTILKSVVFPEPFSP